MRQWAAWNKGKWSVIQLLHVDVWKDFGFMCLVSRYEETLLVLPIVNGRLVTPLSTIDVCLSHWYHSSPLDFIKFSCEKELHLWNTDAVPSSFVFCSFCFSFWFLVEILGEHNVDDSHHLGVIHTINQDECWGKTLLYIVFSNRLVYEIVRWWGA